MTSSDFSIVLPEFLLVTYGMVALLVAVYTGKDKVAGAVTWLTAAVFVLIALIIGLGAGGTHRAFDGMFIDDAFSRFAKVGVLLAGAAVLVMSFDFMVKRGIAKFEYPILVLFSTVGMMVMVSAGDLMALYLGLELMSLSLYVIASFRRDSVKSTESGLKYFVLGSLSSGLLLYGASLTYGFAGTTSFEGILTVVRDDVPLGVLFGLVFIMTGLAFKVSAVPFHMWTPDVYEGAPTPTTAFFATAPKLAAMGLFARVLHDAFGGIPGDWQQVLTVIAVATMFWGAFAGIGQTNIKRLMAYSSITHMGFALMGLAAANAAGVQSALIYMAIYIAMNIGTFAFILTMERDGQPVTDLSALNLYWRSSPVKALALLILMFSLAGVPPMLGFFGKLAVLQAAWGAGLGWLAVLGVIASVIGAFYYLRIVYYMYFGAETEPLDTGSNPVAFAMLTVSALIMLVGIVNMFGVETMAAIAADALVN
ncbi:NADH-quinone oxidoreductase subunit NuoN [Celeribacter indicus]|uniref:NADH-quinone oxidoreductase subunit N n=1 Tax=Celeribacter indicus TaxID=1208324 RepID=A0A0B5DYT3_9RHOB|nr:NADH-quinone oxidoreductase subunit NuoN [Celeribacter indicus]AJE48144.1 NADH:ubiquinone oxidoreductase subunit N [Celeribacter indicus]SDW33675.1 NADH dehydrogenase subunit N [Celeribacter indicus]